MSRFEDPEPASAHNASLVRGRIHAEMVSTEPQRRAHREAGRAAARAAGAARSRTWSRSARAGYAFAFDLPTPALARRVHRPAVLARRDRVRGRHAHRALPAQRQLPRARDRSAVRVDPPLAVVARRPPGREAAGVGGPGRARRGQPREHAGRSASALVPRAEAMRAPARDPRHRVPGLRAGAPHAARGDPRRDRGSGGVVTVAEVPARADELAARRVRASAAARAGGASRRAPTTTRCSASTTRCTRCRSPWRPSTRARHRPPPQGGPAARGEPRARGRRRAALPLRDRPQPRRPHARR